MNCHLLAENIFNYGNHINVSGLMLNNQKKLMSFSQI